MATRPARRDRGKNRLSTKTYQLLPAMFSSNDELSTLTRQLLYASESHGSRHAKCPAMEKSCRDNQDIVFHPDRNLPQDTSTVDYQASARQVFPDPDRHNMRKAK